MRITTSKRRKRSVAERTAGIIKTGRPPLSEELREAAAQATADDLMERMNPHPNPPFESPQDRLPEGEGTM